MNRTNYPYELKAYLKDPPAMEAGAVGKRGKIALEFSLDKTGKKIIHVKLDATGPTNCPARVIF